MHALTASVIKARTAIQTLLADPVDGSVSNDICIKLTDARDGSRVAAAYLGSMHLGIGFGRDDRQALSALVECIAEEANAYEAEDDSDAWYCDDCGELIDNAADGCQNEHCGETPDQKRLREIAEAEACPGCGCKPGDGYTDGCDDPDGCGFFNSELDNTARKWRN